MSKDLKRHQRAREFENAFGQRYCPGRDKPILFHGANFKNYQDMKGCVWTQQNWTTHPGEAITYGFLSAMRFYPELVVYALPSYHGNPLGLAKVTCALNRGSERALHISDGIKFLDEDRKHVKVYFQSDLPKFIEDFCVPGTVLREKTTLKDYLTRLKTRELRRAN